MVSRAFSTGIDGTQLLRDHDDLGADKLARDGGRSVLEDQTDDLAQIRVELFKSLGLTVGPGQTRHVTNVETGVGTAFYDGCVGGTSAGESAFLHRPQWYNPDGDPTTSIGSRQRRATLPTSRRHG